MPTHTLTLTPEQREELESYVHDNDELVRQRARVLLAYATGITQQSVARRLGCSTQHVRKTVRDYLREGGSALTILPASRRLGTFEAPRDPRTELSTIDPLDMDETAVLRLAKHTFLEASSIEDTDARVRRKTDVLKLMLSAIDQRKDKAGRYLRTLDADIADDPDHAALPQIPRPADL